MKPLEIVSTMKVLDEPITTVYKTIEDTKSSPSILNWSNMADEISKMLSVDTQKVTNKSLNNFIFLHNTKREGKRPSA